jgi:ribosomal protein S18 acetylase RimI-like enzyme
VTVGVGILVRRLAEEDWHLLRELRLTALQDAPEAFWATHAQEVGWDEAAWRTRLRDRAVFAGYRDGQPVGLVGGYVDTEGDADLAMMWVHPAARGSGLAGLLVDTVLEWARARELPRVRLWVADQNTSARRLYERRGFVPTGLTGELPHDPPVPEREYAREL